MMRLALSRKFLAIFCLAACSLSSCLVRRRIVTRQGKHDTRPLLTATREELLGRIQTAFDQVNSFSATLDMTPAVGSVYKGEITEFAGVRGYVLFLKPDHIRIIGLDPVIHSKAFDMVSLGADFRLLIPSKNRFILGKNDAPATSPNKLENLRPSAFLEAMLVHPPDAETEMTVLEDDTDEEHALYILLVLKKDGERLWLHRSIYFDRLTLNIVQQKTFNAGTTTVSDTRYSAWQDYGSIHFPSTIDINRPQDGYGVVMKMVELKMNVEIAQDKFELVRPEGTQLHVVGQGAVGNQSPKP